MAQETAVHRWDAENAVGRPAPIATPLAVDGCDELLGFLAWPWDELPSPRRRARSWWCAPTGGRRVTLRPTAVDVLVDDDDDEELGVDAVVMTAASDLLLHLGRLRPRLSRSTATRWRWSCCGSVCSSRAAGRAPLGADARTYPRRPACR